MHSVIDPAILYFGTPVVLVSSMKAMGYRHEPDKFGVARLTPSPAELVAPPRVAAASPVRPRTSDTA